MYPVSVKNDLCPHVFTVLKGFCLGVTEKYSHIKFELLMKMRLCIE